MASAYTNELPEFVTIRSNFTESVPESVQSIRGRRWMKNGHFSVSWASSAATDPVGSTGTRGASRVPDPG
jgi:hypothetical protein